MPIPSPICHATSPNHCQPRDFSADVAICIYKQLVHLSGVVQLAQLNQRLTCDDVGLSLSLFAQRKFRQHCLCFSATLYENSSRTVTKGRLCVPLLYRLSTSKLLSFHDGGGSRKRAIRGSKPVRDDIQPVQSPTLVSVVVLDSD